MKKHTMPEMKEGGVNVTPLIDIVMCLIIFFMLVAKIGVTTGADPNIKPPATLLGVEIEDMGNTLTLNVRDLKKVHEQAVAEAQAAGKDAPYEPTQLEQQWPQVRAMVANDPTPKPLDIQKGELRSALTEAVKFNPKLRVIIMADRDIRYELLQRVLEDCARAKVKDFNFATTKG